MTARAMLLSNEEIMSHAELAASSTCFLLGAQYARSIYEAREKLWRELVNCGRWPFPLTEDDDHKRIAELRALLGIDKEGA